MVLLEARCQELSRLSEGLAAQLAAARRDLAAKQVEAGPRELRLEMMAFRYVGP